MPIDKAKKFLKPFKKDEAHYYVFQKLKESIILGIYREGEQLPSENELCKIFNLSRAVIREALREMEGAGLVETVRGIKGGRFVKKIDARLLVNSFNLIYKSKKVNYGEMIEARKVIECATARMAAISRTEEHIDRMSNILDLKINSKEDFIKINYVFHETVALASQNMFLFYILQALRELIFNSHNAIRFEKIEEANRQHRAVYEAIKNRDFDNAEKAMLCDLDNFSIILINEKRQ